jgi:hypothetical protein
MNTEENENKEISWTITIQSPADQQEQIQAMIDQFVGQVRATGATCSPVQVISMAALSTSIRAAT